MTNGLSPKRAAWARISASTVSGIEHRLEPGQVDLGAGGLDHGSAPADEVEEPVGIGPEKITGVEPAVGVEALLAAALVVPLHQMPATDAQLTDLALRDGGSGVGIDDLCVEPGRGSA